MTKKVFRAKMFMSEHNPKMLPYYNEKYTEWFDTEEEAIQDAEDKLEFTIKDQCTEKENDINNFYFNKHRREVKRNYYYTIESAYHVHEHVGFNYKVEEE